MRAELAAEDAEWRATHHGRLLERLFSQDRETLVYRPMVLDAPAEFERMRAAGVGGSGGHARRRSPSRNR